MKKRQFDTMEDWFLQVGTEMSENDADICSLSYLAEDLSVSVHTSNIDFDDDYHVHVMMMPIACMMVDRSTGRWSLAKHLWRSVCLLVDLTVWKFKLKKESDLTD